MRVRTLARRPPGGTRVLMAMFALPLALLACDGGGQPEVDARTDSTRPDSLAMDRATADSPRADAPGVDLSLDTAPPAEMFLPDAPPPDAPPPDAPTPDAPTPDAPGSPDTAPPPDSTMIADTVPQTDLATGRDGGGPCFNWKDWSNTTAPGVCLAICGTRFLVCIQSSTGIISCDCLIGSGAPVNCFSNKPGVVFPGACKTALEVHNCCRP